MGIMSEIDILRREGAREPEDFMAHGYNRQDAGAMSEMVKAVEPTPLVTCGLCENRVSSGVEYCVECLTAMIAEQGEANG